MKTLAEIQQQLAAGRFEFSRHAFRRVIERNISEQEIRAAGANAAVIEDYPDEVFAERVVARIYRGSTATALSGIVCAVGVNENHHYL